MNRSQRIARASLLGGLLIVAAVAWLSAGVLSPPAGPVAPTMKTLTEVEPRIAISATNTPGDATSLFKITQPGSYYLTGNIQGVASKHGIAVATSGVTVDLNGFDLLGQPGSLDGISGVVIALNNVTVINGSVRNWGGDGVNLAAIGATGCRVERILANHNTGSGIHAGQACTVADCITSTNTVHGIATSFGCTVSGCTPSFNTGDGINTGIGCTVVSCATSHNGGAGISAGPGCTATDCSASYNTGDGIRTDIGATIVGCSAHHDSRGIVVGDGSAITNCSGNSNTLAGISSGGLAGCTVSHCSARSNTGAGIDLGASSAVTDCSANLNGAGGILVAQESRVTHCTASVNTGTGIQTSNGCDVQGCVAGENTVHGISINDGSTAAACTARGNGQHGIICTSHCVLRDNTCASDFDGLQVLSIGNRIEGNTCTGCHFGIVVWPAGGAFLSRNICSGNTQNWSVLTGNFGLVVQGVTVGSMEGNAGGIGPGSTDPNANFSF